MFHKWPKALTSGPDFTPGHLTLTLMSTSSFEQGMRYQKGPNTIAWQDDHPMKDRPAVGTTVQERDHEDAANCQWGET